MKKIKVAKVHGITYNKVGFINTCGAGKLNNQLMNNPDFERDKRRVFTEKEMALAVTCENCKQFADPALREIRISLMHDGVVRKFGRLGRQVNGNEKPQKKVVATTPAFPFAEPPVGNPFPLKIDSLISDSVVDRLLKGRTVVCEVRLRIE